MVARLENATGQPRQKIAIVGTGIAGNVIACQLRDRHDITVFEANDYIGGHSNTVDVAADGDQLKLDTGFIVFNDRTYPYFTRLLDELGVESQESTMSFSVRCQENGLEYAGSSLNTLFAQRLNVLRPSFHRMIRDILRFNRESVVFLQQDETFMTLAEYLARNKYSREFVQHYLIPMGAAIWSAEPRMLQKIPAQFFIRFFHNHGLLSLKNRPIWRVIRNGSQSYVQKLVAGHRDRIRLNSPVTSVIRQGNKVMVRSRDNNAETFDCIFFACHSDQALRILRDASSAEREVLGAIAYQHNEAILHSDRKVMPTRRRAWAAWNYEVPARFDGPATVTYHLNRLQGLSSRRQFFVTLNSDERINRAAVIKKFSYEHPVFNAASIAAQKRRGEINGANRSYFAGAYWRNGFHEDGVVSALNALADFEQKNGHAELHLQRAG
ncbi:MAG: FAD-dependent oxidoreductase [Gammaproteobacteria bacterium]|nr:FAD-dependent oxidoreductase [Gammaproteobacteria bacterium]MDH5501361.1 FAD-dependent oxidoreductase [Gammaproteobacteria bacterium]